MATRFTEAEEAELLKGGREKEKTPREWTRESLLREARRPEDDPLFTETVAIRSLLKTALNTLLLGDKLTADEFSSLLTMVRTGKRKAAKEVMQQYIQPGKP
ncbi:MAG: hypothetical protein M3Y50_08180 [Acidobacteriota bacterium]|nr:hypothetical protein [Acidobacteriota bacterium]